MDDGVIKYSSERIDGAVPATKALSQLNAARTRLFELGLIGAYPDGIGFGNLSVRREGTQFVISVSATGAAHTLGDDQYCLVEAFSIERNWVRSRGVLPASSESLTHGAIYLANAAVQCVIHVHSRSLFDGLLAHGALHTAADTAYGTRAMANAVMQLVQDQPVLPVLFAMAGHDEGVVAYGADVASVTALLVDNLNRMKPT